MTDKTKARLTISPDTVTTLVGGASEYDDLDHQGLIFHPGSHAKATASSTSKSARKTAAKGIPKDSNPPENDDEPTGAVEDDKEEGAS